MEWDGGMLVQMVRAIPGVVGWAMRKKDICEWWRLWQPGNVLTYIIGFVRKFVLAYNVAYVTECFGWYSIAYVLCIY